MIKVTRCTLPKQANMQVRQTRNIGIPLSPFLSKVFINFNNQTALALWNLLKYLPFCGISIDLCGSINITLERETPDHGIDAFLLQRLWQVHGNKLQPLKLAEKGDHYSQIKISPGEREVVCKVRCLRISIFHNSGLTQDV